MQLKCVTATTVYTDGVGCQNIPLFSGTISHVVSSEKSPLGSVERHNPAARAINSLDIDALSAMLRERRASTGLSVRHAARDANVSFMTLSRVESGAQPDLATFLKLCSWLHVAPETFFLTGTVRDVSTVEAVIQHLAKDPRLGRRAAASIAAVVKDMYAALAVDLPPSPTVACHLRAASVLRPGVSKRLGDLLQDMQSELQLLDKQGDL